jgi:hypothetical protein
MNLEALKSSIHGWFYTRFAVSFQTVPHDSSAAPIFPLLIYGKNPLQITATWLTHARLFFGCFQPEKSRSNPQLHDSLVLALPHAVCFNCQRSEKANVIKPKKQSA